MSTIFAELMTFFGISGAPASFSEFVPWIMQVICALGLFLFAWSMVKSMVTSVTRTRY